MLRSKFIGQLANQFADLQNTECGSIAVNRIGAKSLCTVSKALYGLFDLFAISHDMFQHADIAVKRLHTAAPHHHEWNPGSVGQDWLSAPDRPIAQGSPLNQGEVRQAESL